MTLTLLVGLPLSTKLIQCIDNPAHEIRRIAYHSLSLCCVSIRSLVSYVDNQNHEKNLKFAPFSYKFRLCVCLRLCFVVVQAAAAAACQRSRPLPPSARSLPAHCRRSQVCYCCPRRSEQHLVNGYFLENIYWTDFQVLNIYVRRIGENRKKASARRCCAGTV